MYVALLLSKNRFTYVNNAPLLPPEFKGTRLGNCQMAPNCTLYSDRGFSQVIGWDSQQDAVQINDQDNFYMECKPHSSCLNNGGWTNIYFTTFISSALIPGGQTWSLYTAFFNGIPNPPPPRPPPSPSPPRPPVSCSNFLPPPCLNWYSTTNNCCDATQKNVAAIASLLASIKTATNFTDFQQKVRINKVSHHSSLN